MSVRQRAMFEMQCDYPGCQAELENSDGGAWLYDSASEARDAAYDADWLVNAATDQDYCERHSDMIADLDQATDREGPTHQRYPVPLTERVDGCVVCENVRGVPIPLTEFAPTDDLALCGRHWAWWVLRFAQGGTPPCSAHLLGTDRENGCGGVIEAPAEVRDAMLARITPEMQAKQDAARERVRARNARLFATDRENGSER